MSVLLQVVCIAHSPVCSTLRIALRKIVNSFNELGGRGLRCSWFQRGTGRLELTALTAWGEKLLSNLTERALILWYLLPDGRSWKRLWEGVGGVLHDAGGLFSSLKFLIQCCMQIQSSACVCLSNFVFSPL